jgi:membrane associated rhomboid family serine protease
LQDLDPVISQDPGNAYAHALRAYLLRLNGQDYDAGLESSRAARLSYGGRFENCFPPAEPLYTAGYSGAGSGLNNQVDQNAAGGPRSEREAVPTWSRPNGMQRQMIRTRFALSQNPRLVTNALIGINVAVYVVLAILSQSFIQIDLNTLVNAGAQVNLLVSQGQYWRIFTAMFLHFSIAHIGLNMLSLFFIGPAVEAFYGKWRYLVIYLVSGLAGGILTFFISPPQTIAAGASGAIFGVFGALGIFYIVNRQALGAYGRGAITNWLFWIAINLVYGFAVPGIGIWDHIGGLLIGMVVAFLLMPRLRRRTP